MMRRLRSVTVLAAAFALSACFHAVVETGRPAGTKVINKPWAMSFIYGLVPPPVVNTASDCPGGVSKVESQISFLNGLVAALTFSIVTPMTITVTCAGGAASATPAIKLENATPEQKAAAIGQAADLAVKTKAPVYVQF